MINNLVFKQQILLWYRQTRTQYFPWQSDKTIYNTWVSEIMLQQTQVTTVISYYLKFIEKFPTIYQLASSELDEVLYIWSGLGYYKRAINLHKTAKIIVQNYNGEFPQDFDTLLSFPGIGRSTAGAILSLALDKHYPILDTNIKRILIRYYHINCNIIKKSTLNNKLWSLIKQLIPYEDISIFNQAMMDLGRLICTNINPTCNICPISNNCQAFLKKNIDQCFKKTSNKKKIAKNIWWLILLFKKNNIVWLQQRSQEEIWKKLFCFPEFDTFHALQVWLLQHKLHNIPQNNMDVLRHKISSINFGIQPVLLNINNCINFDKKDGIWYNLHASSIIGLPKPVSVILNNLKI